MQTDILTDPGHSREDLRMIRQAIRHDWDIPEQLMSALPKVAGAMALDKKEKPATRLKAMETILKMKAQNESPSSLEPGQRNPSGTINVGVSVGNVSERGRTLASVVLARLRNDGVPCVVSGGHAGNDSGSD